MHLDRTLQSWQEKNIQSYPIFLVKFSYATLAANHFPQNFMRIFPWDGLFQKLEGVGGDFFTFAVPPRVCCHFFNVYSGELFPVPSSCSSRGKMKFNFIYTFTNVMTYTRSDTFSFQTVLTFLLPNFISVNRLTWSSNFLLIPGHARLQLSGLWDKYWYITSLSMLTMARILVPFNITCTVFRTTWR